MPFNKEIKPNHKIFIEAFRCSGVSIWYIYIMTFNFLSHKKVFVLYFSFVGPQNYFLNIQLHKNIQMFVGIASISSAVCLWEDTKGCYCNGWFGYRNFISYL